MTSKSNPHIILASASPRRLELLKQINIIPNQVIAADIDETQLKGEKPKDLALRLSKGKAQAVSADNSNTFILGADTVVACGQQVLGKPENEDQARQYIQKLSGRRHQVHGGITLVTPDGRELTRHCVTMVQFKPLTSQEIDEYINTNEWEGKAGGYAIQGYAGAFVKYMTGSYSNVVGLSLYDTMKMIKSAGLNTNKTS